MSEETLKIYFMKEEINRAIEEFKKTNPRKDIIEILDRGICYAENNPVNEILFTCINPAFNQKKSNKGILPTFTFADADQKIRYWKRLHTIVGDLLPKTAYLDLFPLIETSQKKFEKTVPLELKKPLLIITQKEIERIKPKLIIVGNRASRAYWGAIKKYSWMGYKFEEIESPLKDKDVVVYRIVGLRDDNEKISSETCLQGTVVVFSSVSYCYPKVKTLSPENVKCLYEFASEI